MRISSKEKRAFFVALFLILSCSMAASAPVSEEKTSQRLSAKMLSSPEDESIPVIVLLFEKNDSIEVYKEKVKRRYSLINAASMGLTANEIEKLEKDPRVERIYLDDVLKVTPLPSDQPASAKSINLDSIGATYTQDTLGYTGEGVTIAIIDSGIDYTHPDLGGCFGSSCKVKDGYDFVNSDGNPMDDYGHGTHCAGIAAANGAIKGVAPDADLLAVKVLDSGGQGFDSEIIAGIDWAVANGADVISLSLGGSEKPSDGFDVLQMVCDAAVNKGVVVVAAMGNEGPGTGTIADVASSFKVISVAAVNNNGNSNPADDYVADFSSRGPASFGRLKPEVAAPGVSICSAKSDVCVIPYHCTNYCGDSQHISMPGTSMATPHAAGAAALLLEYNSNLSPKQIKSILMQSAEDVSQGTLFEVGAGEINITRAIQSRVNASIDYEPAWEETVLPGMNKTAALRIKNNKGTSVNLSILVSSLYDTEEGWSIDYDQFSYQNNVSLSPGQEKQINVTLSVDVDEAPGTYGGMIRINGSGEALWMPVAITVPLLGAGTISGHVDSEEEDSDWGDWVFYKIKSINGTTIRLNLTWNSTGTDLDMYTYSPDGVLVNVSGLEDTNWEYGIIENPVYGEHWVGIHAYDLDDSLVYYDLSVTYTSSVRLDPAVWQGTLPPSKTTILNFTLINDGSANTGLALETACLKKGASKRISSSIDDTDEEIEVVWIGSTSGLNLDDARYLNASLRWGSYSKDLDLYFVCKEDSTWDTTRLASMHRNDLLGAGEEDLSMIDIKQFRETCSDTGVGISNPGSSESYTLTLNFTDEGACSYASTTPASISTLSSGQSRTVQVSINTATLTLGRDYESSLIVEDDGAEIARMPISFQVASTTTSTTTTSSTTSTTLPPCELAGDVYPCGAIEVTEVVGAIDEWITEEMTLQEILDLLTAWLDQ